MKGIMCMHNRLGTNQWGWPTLDEGPVDPKISKTTTRHTGALGALQTRRQLAKDAHFNYKNSCSPSPNAPVGCRTRQLRAGTPVATGTGYRDSQPECHPKGPNGQTHPKLERAEKAGRKTAYGPSII